MEIKCPGKKLYHLLDGLNPDKFKELKATDKYGLPEIRERLRISFPNFSDDMLKGLAKAAEAEYQDRVDLVYTNIKTEINAAATATTHGCPVLWVSNRRNERSHRA